MSFTSTTLPKVPSPRVETISSERVKVNQLQPGIWLQITTLFNTQPRFLVTLLASLDFVYAM